MQLYPYHHTPYRAYYTPPPPPTMRTTCLALLLGYAAQCSAGPLASTVLQPYVDADDAEGVRKAVASGGLAIDERNPSTGQSSLMYACLRGKPAAAEALLGLGADAGVAEKDGYNCPHGAAFQGRPEVMAVLHAHNIDLRGQHSDGYEPIHRTAWGTSPGHAAALQYLVSVGVPFNAASKEGRTPLQMSRPGTPVHDALLKLAEEAEL